MRRSSRAQQEQESPDAATKDEQDDVDELIPGQKTKFAQTIARFRHAAATEGPSRVLRTARQPQSPQKKVLVEQEVEVKEDDVEKTGQKRKRGTPTAGEAPADWEEMYSQVKDMRAKVVAPVDTMGCERLAEATASEKDQRFQTLIALMLSSQTKDTVTAVAMANMRNNLPGGLNLESILQVSEVHLDNLIRTVGFHNRKTEYIKKTAVILRDKFNGDIPDSIEGLTSLPGVGPKMAYLCLSAAWNRTEGIGVDVHVHRITNLWKWNDTKTPEATRAALESWLPKDKWREINWLLVGFGQTICLPRTPKCNECTLAENRLCPAPIKWKKISKKVVKKEEPIDDAVKHELLDDAVKFEDSPGDSRKKEEPSDAAVLQDSTGRKREPEDEALPQRVTRTVVVKEEVVEDAKIPDIEDLVAPPERGQARRSSRKKT